MKTSIIISVILALLVGFVGWRNQSKMAAFREERKALETEASRLGISSNQEDATSGSATAHRQRPNREATARATAADMIAFAREMDALQKSGGEPSEMGRFQERVLELMDRMASLDSSQLKTLIAEFRSASDLSDETRLGLISFAVMTLTKEHPQMALALFTETSDLFRDTDVNRHMVSSALTEWAKSSPDAALEWVRANKEKHADLISGQVKAGLISGIAANDPKRAFELLNELTDESSQNFVGSGISSIIQAARTSHQQAATLEAFRAYTEGISSPEEKQMATKNAFNQFAIHFARDGFESASSWIETAKMSPEELDAFAGALSYTSKSSDKAKWIGWISETLPAGKSGEPIKQMVRHWTSEDYKTAGEWLVAEPEGPSKNIAIQAYAETVAPYEPDTAAQWALTLPTGKERDNTLKRIHRELKGKDPDAAAAFAEKHGIK